ncbi:MAG: cytochrome c [Bacteroidetes bacterium]|nr:cytochrome c [Bacteroidota bacterium]
MKKIVLVIGAIVCANIIIVSSCKKSKNIKCDGTNSTYNGNIKPIISANCTGSGCHGTGSGNGDFTTYAGLKPFLDNGKFKSEVLDKQSMPKGAAKLSDDELSKITCWAENSYPEN